MRGILIVIKMEQPVRFFKSGGQYRSRREDGKPLNKVKATGWEQVDSKWYYYENYVMVTGWKKISGIWYYFNSSGVMQNWVATI